MNKKGMELSVNFLVVVIISLVVLGMGLYFLYSLMGGALNKKEELDQRTQQELLRLLIDEGKKVALPLHVADIYSGDSHVFGIGILSVGLETNEVFLDIKLNNAVDGDGNPLQVDASQWVLYTLNAIPMKEAEHRIEPILVDVPPDAKKGKYIFDAKVFTDSAKTQQYGNTQKFIVNVG